MTSLDRNVYAPWIEILSIINRAQLRGTIAAIIGVDGTFQTSFDPGIFVCTVLHIASCLIW